MHDKTKRMLDLIYVYSPYYVINTGCKQNLEIFWSSQPIAIKHLCYCRFSHQIWNNIERLK